MAQQIDRHHRQGPAGIQHILGVGIVYTQILAKAQGLGVEPGLLQLYQDELFLAVAIAHRRAEVNAKHRKAVAGFITILMGAHLHSRHLHLEEC